MPWGSGTFSRTDGTRTGSNVWAQAKAAAVKIIAADHDTHDQDLATGINSCVNKDGSNSFTGDADLGNNQIKSVAAGTAATDAATIGGSETLTNKTLTSPTLTSPTLTTPVIAQINDTNGNEILLLTPVASAVNEITIKNAATGNAPIILISGESDIGLELQNAAGEEILVLASVPSAVNEITITNAATGNAPILQASGESDIGFEFHNAAGEELLILSSVASAVNELTIANAATGNAPSIAVSGETNVDLELTPAGTGRLKENGVPVCRLKTGSYVGDGSTSKAITGVGFQPIYLRIWTSAADTASGAVAETSDNYMAQDAQGLALIHSSTGDITGQDNRILSLDSDGFTVSDDSADNFPNASGVSYRYVAWG